MDALFSSAVEVRRQKNLLKIIDDIDLIWINYMYIAEQ